MIKLKAKIRKDLGRKTRSPKKADKIPAIVYGSDAKNIVIEVNYEEFKKVFNQTGESSLINLEIEDEKKPARSATGVAGGGRPVLIHEIQNDPVSGKFLHIDFYQPSLKQEVEVAIPLVFEGVAPAIKELGGTLVKEIQEIKVKALPQNLPHDVKVDVTSLKTFEDEIFIKDLKIPAEVKVLKNPDEIVAKVVPPTKVKEELEKPIEEKVEEVEKVEKEKKVEEVIEEEQPVKPATPKAPEKK